MPFAVLPYQIVHRVGLMIMPNAPVPGDTGVGNTLPPVPHGCALSLNTAKRETSNTQLALRADVTANDVLPGICVIPVSVTVNNTRNRPCIWSYVTVEFSIRQLIEV